MDAFASIHPVPAAWLSNSSLAPFVPDYWRCLIERRYAAATARSYLYGVAHFARWPPGGQVSPRSSTCVQPSLRADYVWQFGRLAERRQERPDPNRS
jgi:hypothetical protein